VVKYNNMGKNINYSRWLKLRTGKSMWDLFEEGYTIGSIISYGAENGITIPEKYISNYRKYWEKNKLKGTSNTDGMKNNTDTGNNETINTDTSKMKDNTSNNELDIFSRLSNILDKLLELGVERIKSGEIVITASDIVRAVELRKQIGEEGKDVQQTINKLLGD